MKLKRHGCLVALAFLALIKFALAADPTQGVESAGDTDLPPMVMEPAESTPESATTTAAPSPTPAPAPAPETKAEPEPAKNAEAAPAPTPAPVPAPETPKEEAVVESAPAPDEEILENPTRSIEDYEKARQSLIHKTSIPDWSVNLTLEPKAFKNTDFRAKTGSTSPSDVPVFMGILVGGERMVLKYPGLLSLGIESGLYSSTTKDKYSNLQTGLITAAPYTQYEGVFVPRQWVVPTVKFEYEFVRYNYKFDTFPVRGVVQMPRVDLGVLVYLNIFEPSSAGQMSSNYGIKRTYLSVYYTVSNDRTKQDFDLSDRGFKIGFRFEQ